MKSHVFISNRQKAVELPDGTRSLLRRCVLKVLELEGITQPAEVSITLVDDKAIAVLNGEYRGKNTPTDVLSFPMGEDGVYDQNMETGELLLGDVVLSAETAVRQAAEYGHSLERELGFLTVHSVCHLLGYDHEAGGEAEALMRQKEEAALTRLGLPRKPVEDKQP